MKDMVGLILQKMENTSDFEKLKFLYKDMRENSGFLCFKKRAYECLESYIRIGSTKINIFDFPPRLLRYNGEMCGKSDFLRNFFSKCKLTLLKKNNYERDEQCEYLVLSDEFLLSFYIGYKKEINYLMEELHLKFIIEDNTYVYLSWAHWKDL